MSAPRYALSRRSMMRGAALGATVLLLEVKLTGGAFASEAEGFASNPFVGLAEDGTVSLFLPKSEMGQSVYTALAMLVAEELELDPAAIAVTLPPGDAGRFGEITQDTGGSTSIREVWQPLRQAAADMRAALTEAAARRWQVVPEQCSAEGGAIVHSATGRRLTYSELAAEAAAAPLPSKTPLKLPSEFRVIGQSTKRLDAPAKVRGEATYGIDVRVPGMKIAALAQSPTIGGKLGAIDESAAMKVAGVRQIVRLDDAVAVIADHYWAAKKGLDALAPQWLAGPNESLDQSALVGAITNSLAAEGAFAVKQGDVDAALRSAAQRVEATYDQPFLAHAAMEPGNCVVEVRAGSCEIWTGTQIPGSAREQAGTVLGLSAEKVTLHNYTLGGAFGRRLEADMILRALQIGRQVDGPVKIIWSREEDIQHDIYRPYYQDRLVAGLDINGRPVAWQHRIAGSSIMARLYPKFYEGVDSDAVEGAQTTLYGINAREVEWVRQESPVTTGWWRGVGGLRSAFAVESFIDELASTAHADPLAYRRSLISDERALAVLDLVSEKSDWGRATPQGTGRGVAVLNIWETYVALVLEVMVKADGELKIPRAVMAVDCGQPVNPAGIRQQLESGVIFGLSAALFGEITFAGGKVEQSNFHDYRPLRMDECPAIESHIVKSSASPGGLGEPPAAVVAPALVNAVFAGTGKRIRALPVVKALAAEA